MDAERMQEPHAAYDLGQSKMSNKERWKWEARTPITMNPNA